MSTIAIYYIYYKCVVAKLGSRAGNFSSKKEKGRGERETEIEGRDREIDGRNREKRGEILERWSE